MQKGFTIMEIMVGIIVSGIVISIALKSYSQVHSGVYLEKKKEQDRQGVEVFQGILERKLSQAKELLFLNEDSLAWVNPKGEKQSLTWSENALLWNNKNVFKIDTIYNVEVNFYSFPFDEYDRATEWDQDVDLILNQEELDLDYSGEITGEELKFLGQFSIAFQYGTPPRQYKRNGVFRNQVRWNYD